VRPSSVSSVTASGASTRPCRSGSGHLSQSPQDHSAYARASHGTLWTWDHGDYGQIGDRDTSERTSQFR